MYIANHFLKKPKVVRYLHSSPGNFGAAPGIVDKQDGAKSKRGFCSRSAIWGGGGGGGEMLTLACFFSLLRLGLSLQSSLGCGSVQRDGGRQERFFFSVCIYIILFFGGGGIFLNILCN